ncbi:MAG: hypothetical protein FWF53_02960 [Candidatus Azobacteroides sp.]|nr:hypothetical protein [Candidatus Azobacteroides sp.]
MKEKILALLQAQFAGVRKDGLNQIANVLSFQIDTEEKAKEVVGKLTADQVNSFIADWRKEADAEIDKANRTREENLRKKYDFVEKKQPEVTAVTTENGNFDTAAIQKLISDSIATATKPLLEKVAAFEKEGTEKTRLQALNDKLKECTNENFKVKALKDFARMRFDTDEAFTEYLSDTENDIKTANQNVADSGLGAQSRPIISNSSSGGKEATDAEIKAVMDLLPIN